MTIIKTIKFDLPIDGVKVKNIEELREHFNTEILDLHKSGLLVKWLKSQRQSEITEKVENISVSAADQDRLNQLCRIFSIELDAEIIQQLIQAHHATAHTNGTRIDPVKLEHEQFHEKYKIFMTAFKKYERFEEYCKNLNASETIASGNAELIQMAHFIETGEKIHITELSCEFESKEGHTYDSPYNKATSHTSFSIKGDIASEKRALNALSIKKSGFTRKGHYLCSDIFTQSYYLRVDKDTHYSYPPIYSILNSFPHNWIRGPVDYSGRLSKAETWGIFDLNKKL
jgi:hypothetical protein